jgi:RNA polymerase sigma-70 factor (ECF subfamily)
LLVTLRNQIFEEGRILDPEIKAIKNAKKNIADFDFLYRKYYPKINNFVYHRVREESVKNEIVSNIFFKAMKKIHLFRFFDSRKSSFQSWLYRIAISEINQYFRDETRERKIQGMYKINYNPDPSMKIDFEIVRAELKNLSNQEQNLITLKYFEKLSYKEIAEIYKKSEGALKVQVHRALKKLREALYGEIENERPREQIA